MESGQKVKIAVTFVEGAYLGPATVVEDHGLPGGLIVEFPWAEGPKRMAISRSEVMDGADVLVQKKQA